jgi:hypothetical protein
MTESEYYAMGDEDDAFSEYLEEEFVRVGSLNGDAVWYDSGEESVFKINDGFTWVSAREDSYWEFEKTELEKEELIELLTEKL